MATLAPLLPHGVRGFVVGEVQFGDTEADWHAWTRYEAALNETLDTYDARVICPSVLIM